jgi:hypothetical protein
MGLFSFFKDRRAKESAVPSSEALGSFASPEGQAVVGQQIGAAGAETHSQTIDMRGTGLREEILGIMQQHGIDAESGTARNVDAAVYGDMQQELLAALARHGIDPGASGTSLNFQIEPKDD